MTDEAIRDRYHYHPPTKEGAVRHDALANVFVEVAKAVEELVPNGHEKNAAHKYLESAKMWASAGVARNPDTR